MYRYALFHLIPSQCRRASNTFPSGYQPYRTIVWALHQQKARPSFYPGVTGQRRWASQAQDYTSRIPNRPHNVNDNGPGNNNDEDFVIAYRAPLASVCKKLNVLSFSAYCLSLVFGPSITFTKTDLNVNLAGLAVASSVFYLSVQSTIVLHSYIHKLRWQPGSDNFEVERSSWMGTTVTETIRFQDTHFLGSSPNSNPFVGFLANGNFYWMDSSACHDKAFLGTLTSQEQSRTSEKQVPDVIASRPLYRKVGEKVQEVDIYVEKITNHEVDLNEGLTRVKNELEQVLQWLKDEQNSISELRGVEEWVHGYQEHLVVLIKKVEGLLQTVEQLLVGSPPTG